VVVGIVDQVHMHTAQEELHPLQRMLLQPEELHLGPALAAVLHLE
jgi:hypothetical protein